jgi:formylglycine-generating enzyme required for sulfatase activity
MNVNQTKTTCIVFACLAMLLLPFQLQAEGPVVEKPHTFSAGTPARASEVNENFDRAYEHIQKLVEVVCKYHPTEPMCQTTEPQETWTNDFGMTFVLIQPGTFVMGSPEGETGRDSNEVQHNVTLTQKYYLQTTEVTQGQWKAVMGSNPSDFSGCGDDCPVEQVSWEDAQAFIEKLNLHENANRYSLPTEAQWEYAARAGSTTALANGNLVETGCSLDTNLNAMGWYCGNADGKTHPVAQKQPNAWGLYDMHGNVWEWCKDWYGSYPDISVTDPGGASSGSTRVGRGGGCYEYAQHCRSAERDSTSPGTRYDSIGLRLSRTLKP